MLELTINVTLTIFGLAALLTATTLLRWLSEYLVKPHNYYEEVLSRAAHPVIGPRFTLRFSLALVRYGLVLWYFVGLMFLWRR